MGRKGKRGILILLAAVCLTLSAWMLWPRALELSGEGNYSILVIRTAVEAGRPDSETVTLDIQVRSPEGVALQRCLSQYAYHLCWDSLWDSASIGTSGSDYTFSIGDAEGNHLLFSGTAEMLWNGRVVKMGYLGDGRARQLCEELLDLLNVEQRLEN